MKRTSIIIAILLLTLLSSPVCAEKEYTLTPEQSHQWAQLAQIEKNASDAYDRAILRAVNTAVGEQSKEVHAAVQAGWLSVNLVKAQKGEFLARLQAEHDCKGCVIADTAEPAWPTGIK